MHAPEDTGKFIEVISLPRPMAQFRLVSRYRSLSSLDGVTRTLVLSIVRGFVVRSTVQHDLASFARLKVLLLAAKAATRGQDGVFHCGKSIWASVAGGVRVSR